MGRPVVTLPAERRKKTVSGPPGCPGRRCNISPRPTFCTPLKYRELTTLHHGRLLGSDEEQPEILLY